jgi:tetratricopeptide (TPR) repeat protein
MMMSVSSNWPLAGDDKESLAACHRALDLLVTHRGIPSAEVERLLADHPHSVPGHCLRAGIIVRNDDRSKWSKLAESLACIEAACPSLDDPARRHAAAARAWLEGDPSFAAESYGKIVIDWPRDMLALAVAQALDFRLGRRRTMRDRIAQLLPEWDATVRGYASLLAMYAFALEENGQYARAEKMARRALELDTGHPGAIHVLAHVMEMQGRAREGLAFLAATEPAWSQGTAFSVHLAWHRALFHLDANDPQSALATYDAQIAIASDMNALADGSALLWRLQLRNIELGARWRLLADRWEEQRLADAGLFHIAHAMMAFAAAERTVAAARLIEALPHIDMTSALPSLPENELVLPFCEGLLAFARGDYAACVDALTRVRHIAHRCGGSLAQCDLIHLTYTEAALRAQRARLARALVAERTAQKPASRLNRLLEERLRAMPSAIA